jgi:S-formylglutathione hydrolase FrmB
VLSRYEPARRPRRRWPVVLAVVIAVAAVALIVKGRLDAANRGYSDTHGATVVRYSLASKLVGRDLQEIAIVPPGTGTRPLLVLLHGRHDPSRLSWLIPAKTGPESMLSDALFAGLAALGKQAPVVVLLNGGDHSYYHDRHDGRWGSMILDEAIPDAARRFGTAKDVTAIGGISMGGYGALHLAALRPSEFCAVGGHSAALWESGGASAPGAFDDAADFSRSDVFADAQKGRFDHLVLWIDGGVDDPFHDADAAFVAHLRDRGLHVKYHVWPGAHTRAYWNAHMAAYLHFYAGALEACRS